MSNITENNIHFDITEAFLAKVKEAVDIEDVIGEKISLIRRGANYKGKCPFHDDKNPSFVVSPAKQIYSCFSCGLVGKDAIDFLMRYEDIGFRDALVILAQQYNIELPKREVSEAKNRDDDKLESLRILHEVAAQYYENRLFEAENVGALAYFRDERGFSEETIRKFRLGVASGPADAFYQYAKKKGWSDELLLFSGLVCSNERGMYDFFRNRYMFAIQSMLGHVVAFSGRRMSDADKRVPKYVNSPESLIFKKGKVLYGYVQGRTAIGKANSVILVEGYTDVISLHQAGMGTAVAAMGTALHEYQLQRICKKVDSVVVLNDGDLAGNSAANKHIPAFLAKEKEVWVCPLEEGIDPDKLARKKGSAVSAYIVENRCDFVTYKARFIKDFMSGSDSVYGQASVVKSIVRAISLVPASNVLLRYEYVRKCASILNLPISLLLGALDMKVPAEKVAAKKRPVLERNCPAVETAFMAQLLVYGSMYHEEHECYLSDYFSILFSNGFDDDDNFFGKLKGGRLHEYLEYGPHQKLFLAWQNDSATETPMGLSDYLNHADTDIRTACVALNEWLRFPKTSPRLAFLDLERAYYDFGRYRLSLLLGELQKELRSSSDSEGRVALQERYLAVAKDLAACSLKIGK